MDWEAFSSQAQELTKAAERFPQFQLVWRIDDSNFLYQSYLELRIQKSVQDLILSLTITVTWSQSYQVPVLYFRACDLLGVPLSYDQVKSLILNRTALEEDGKLRWGLVSAVEHPITGEPVYMVHPCASAVLLGPNQNLVRWLSVVLQIVQVRMPLSLALS